MFSKRIPWPYRQLTKSLLHRDFDLRIDLPEDRLCPPVRAHFHLYHFRTKRRAQVPMFLLCLGAQPVRTYHGLDEKTHNEAHFRTYIGSTTFYSFSGCWIARLQTSDTNMIQIGKFLALTCKSSSLMAPIHVPLPLVDLADWRHNSGTGSSCIYPLLACRQRPNWLFLATEIDEKNRSYALKNIGANDLQSRIRLIDTDKENKTLIPSDQLQRFER